MREVTKSRCPKIKEKATESQGPGTIGLKGGNDWGGFTQVKCIP